MPNTSTKDVVSTIARRVGMPIYIPLVALICSFLLIGNKEKRNKVAQTLLNHIDVTINQKQSNEVDLFVRRSFAEHLCSWMNDSARFI